jgi:outer membrane protein
MKKFIILIFLIFTQFNFVNANTNIVFVDLDKIMTMSKPGLSIIKKLREKNDKILNNFQVDQKKLKDKEAKIVKQKKILSDKEFESNFNKLKLEFDTYNKKRKNTINDFDKLKFETRNKFVAMINLILMKYAEEKSILMIFEKKNMIIGKAELDITDEIIKIVNVEIKEFKIE